MGLFNRNKREPVEIELPPYQFNTLPFRPDGDEYNRPVPCTEEACKLLAYHNMQRAAQRKEQRLIDFEKAKQKLLDDADYDRLKKKRDLAIAMNSNNNVYTATAVAIAAAAMIC